MQFRRFKGEPNDAALVAKISAYLDPHTKVIALVLAYNARSHFVLA